MDAPTSDDVRIVSRLCRTTLEPHVDRDWHVPAGTLEWDCHQTVGHIADALGFYAAHLAGRATEWLKFDVVPHTDASNLHVARLVETMGEMLAQVLEAAPQDARAFHHSGMRSRDSIAAMGCEETLMHTSDVTTGLGVTFEPPRDICRRVAAELFAEPAEAEDPWRFLLWATGRGEVEGKPPLGPDWAAYWARRD